MNSPEDRPLLPLRHTPHDTPRGTPRDTHRWLRYTLRAVLAVLGAALLFVVGLVVFFWFLAWTNQRGLKRSRDRQ